MTKITGPEIQLLGVEGECHLIKIQYIYHHESYQTRKGVILRVKPEDLPTFTLSQDLIHYRLDNILR